MFKKNPIVIVVPFKENNMKKRNYTSQTVQRLQGSVQIEHTLAKRGMASYSEMQQREFAAQERRFTTVANKQSTETHQF